LYTYWQLVASILKLDPLSDGWMKSLSFNAPRVLPAVRNTAIVAGGNWQVDIPFTASVNLTGTTPRLALNTLDPFALIGGWMVALYTTAAGVKAVSVNDCVAFASTPLLAVMVIGYAPPVPAAGVPLSVAVPLPLSVKVTPLGSAPVFVIVTTVGNPLVVTVNVPALPTVNVAAFALVMAGA
jgi:hypothetical protein